MMNVLYTLDNNFFPQMMISLTSLIEHTHCKLNIYIICDDISIRNRNLLSKVKSHKVEITIKSSPRLPPFLIADRGSNSQFYRLFIGEIFKNTEIKKILFIDCDTLVVSSKIQNLFNTNLGERVIGACIDPWSYKYNEIFHIGENKNMFNAGILLVNVEKWKYHDIDNKLIQLAEKRKHFFQADQGLLNEFFSGNFKVLLPEANLVTSYFDFDYEDLISFRNPVHFYSKKQVERSINHPVIIHFTSSFTNNRPWMVGSKHPETMKWRDLYLRVMKRHIRLVKPNKSLISCIYRILPHHLGILFISFLQCELRPLLVMLKIKKLS